MAGLAENPNTAIVIRFKSPASNNHGDRVTVDHVDLIAGAVTGLVPPALADGSANSEYYKPVNPTTAVLARFNKGDWEQDKEGWNKIRLQLKATADSYFRLRGTNNRIGRDKAEIGKDGNPVLDVPGENTPEKTWADLWFYSNPIFVDVP